MANPDPNTPQVVDPELVVDLGRLLQIRGPLGVLNVLDTIVPVVNMGDVVTRTVTVLQPAFRSTDVFSAGVQTAAAAGTIHANTGPLAAGTYDIHLQVPQTLSTSHVWDVRHRNAADNANMAIWSTIVLEGAGGAFTQTFGYEFALNESMTIVNISAFAVGEGSVAFLFARRRT